MQWWCSAQLGAWTWTWQPYLGVWVFVALVGLAIRRLYRAAPRPTDPRRIRARRGRIAAAAAALFVLWLALDWPLGALGASYLASLHMVQFLLIGIVVPALLLIGLPAETFWRLRGHPTALHWVQELTRPPVAFFVFNGVVSITHWPSVTDALMASQLGAFGLDLSWLLAGLIFWWPVFAPVPARPNFNAIFKVAYLAANAIIIRPPFAILVFSTLPVYETYELAPPLFGTNALDDQQLAGGVMKVGSAWLMAAGIAWVAWTARKSYRTSGSV